MGEWEIEEQRDRAERKELARWASLVKEPDCRADSAKRKRGEWERGRNGDWEIRCSIFQVGSSYLPVSQLYFHNH